MKSYAWLRVPHLHILLTKSPICWLNALLWWVNFEWDWDPITLQEVSKPIRLSYALDIPASSQRWHIFGLLIRHQMERLFRKNILIFGDMIRIKLIWWDSSSRWFNLEVVIHRNVMLIFQESLRRLIPSRKKSIGVVKLLCRPHSWNFKPLLFIRAVFHLILFQLFLLSKLIYMFLHLNVLNVHYLMLLAHGHRWLSGAIPVLGPVSLFQ